MENGAQLPTDSTDLIITESQKSRDISQASSSITCKSILIIIGLIILFIVLFGLSFGLGIYVGPKIIQTFSQKKKDSSLPFDPSETSEFGLNYQVSVSNNVPKDEVKFRILTQIEKDLSKKLGENYHRYFINSIECKPNLIRKDQTCHIDSLVKFKKKIAYEPNNSGNLGVDYLNTILQYLKTNPLKNLNFITDSSDLMNKNQNDLLTSSKSSGNTELGVLCKNSYECDLNMVCLKEINEIDTRCKCNNGHTSIISSKTGHFECIKSRLNYHDHCTKDSDCYKNSVCSKKKCVCKPEFIQKKGLCVPESNENLSCNTDNDCLSKSSLMKCQNSRCVCFMGYHLEDSFCVSGSVKLNSACSIGLECGLNAFCSNQKICTCNSGMSSSNGFDCYLSAITTSRVFFQFVYQDTLNPPDEIDQIKSFTRNSYDQILYKYSNLSLDFANYNMLDVDVYEYSKVKARWLIQLEIGLNQPIKLTETLFKNLVNELITAKDIKLVTVINSTGYVQTEFMNYFYDIYPARTTSIKKIGEYCSIDNDCIDRNSSCIVTCTDSNCLNTAKVCKCKIGFYEAIDTKNNQKYCEFGKKLKSQCFDSDPISCGKNMMCVQGSCACIFGYVISKDSCILENDFLPNSGCVTSNDCPIFSKCQQGKCICYSGFTLVDGLCKASSDSCLGPTYCGQNAFCNRNSLTCKCLNGFQVAKPTNQECVPVCNCLQ